MKRQISELTFQQGCVKDAGNKIKQVKTSVQDLTNGYTGTSFVVLLSLAAARKCAAEAEALNERASLHIDNAIGLAQTTLEQVPEKEIPAIEIAEVAAHGITAIQMSEAAQMLLVKAEYHLAKATRESAAAPAAK